MNLFVCGSVRAYYQSCRAACALTSACLRVHACARVGVRARHCASKGASGPRQVVLCFACGVGARAHYVRADSQVPQQREVQPCSVTSPGFPLQPSSRSPCASCTRRASGCFSAERTAFASLPPTETY